jgi:hypothetical protein
MSAIARETGLSQHWGGRAQRVTATGSGFILGDGPLGVPKSLWLTRP